MNAPEICPLLRLLARNLLRCFPMPTLGSVVQDIRFALRYLGSRPGFTALVLLTLALGIGANTAILSVTRAVLLSPLPLPESDRLVSIWERELEGTRSQTSFATFEDLAARSRSLERIAVLGWWATTVGGTGPVEVDPERLAGLKVSQGFFGSLGVRPALGRDFLPEEDRPGAPRVAMLSHGLWQRRFGADPGIVGKEVLLDGRGCVVVGVLPDGFESPVQIQIDQSPEIYTPLRYDATLPWACRTCRHLRAFGRLRPGVTLTQAAAELNAISADLVREHPQDYPAPGLLVSRVQDDLVGPARPALLLLQSTALLVLLIAATNVAGLLLGWASGRRHEVAVRLSLGAGRARVVRQLITESLLLAVMGGALGLLVAGWAIEAFRVLAAGRVPRLTEVRMDATVLAATLGITLLTGLLFGLAPAVQACRHGMHAIMKESGGGAMRISRHRLRAGFVVCQVGLSVVLLMKAVLLVMSLGRLMSVDPGFDRRQILTLDIPLAGPAYQGREDVPGDPVLAFYRRVLEEIGRLPGVESAGVVSQLPLGGNFDTYGIHIEEKPSPNPANDPSADRYAVSPDYLRTMRIPIVKGRGITEADGPTGSPVALINEAFARRHWPGEDPIGRRFRLGDPNGPWRTIVGITGNVRHQALDAPDTLQIYLPHAQWTDSMMTLVIRARVDPATLVSGVRAAIRGVDPLQAVARVATMEEVVRVSTGERRLLLALLGSFAVLALALAAVGIYGLMAFSVVQRTQEIGVRMALGARPVQILWMVLRQGGLLTLMGLAAGGAGALASAPLVSAFLYGVRPADPVMFAVVALVLLAVAAIASVLPARWATRVNPMTALRAE